MPLFKSFFPIKYYLTAMLFIVFDIEIIFLYPYAVANKAQKIAAEINRLQSKYDQYELRIANALWGEKTGTFTNTDRTVHLSDQAVDPPGEARADREITDGYERQAVITAAANTASFAAPSAGTTAPAAGSGTAGDAAVASVAVASVAVAFSFSASDWRVRRLPLRRLTLFLFIVILGGGRGWGERGEFRCRNARACLGIFEGATYIITSISFALGSLTLGGVFRRNVRAGSLTSFPSGGQQRKRAFCIIRLLRRLQLLDLLADAVVLVGHGVIAPQTRPPVERVLRSGL